MIFLILMLAISKVSAIRFGFGWGDRQEGLSYLRLFVLIFIGYVVVHRLIILILTGSLPVFWHPLTARNIIGQLGFQLLLTGPSEELIFRAFAITMLALPVNADQRFRGVVFSNKDAGAGKAAFTILGGELSVANLIAAIIFGLAHVRFTFTPFSVSFDTGNFVVAVIIGLFYCVCYERS